MAFGNFLGIPRRHVGCQETTVVTFIALFLVWLVLGVAH